MIQRMELDQLNHMEKLNWYVKEKEINSTSQAHNKTLLVFPPVEM